MSDVNYAHEFMPNIEGRCKVIVGGKRRGYRICGGGEDSHAHQKWNEIQKIAERDDGQADMHCG